MSFHTPPPIEKKAYLKWRAEQERAQKKKADVMDEILSSYVGSYLKVDDVYVKLLSYDSKYSVFLSISVSGEGIHLERVPINHLFTLHESRVVVIKDTVDEVDEDLYLFFYDKMNSSIEHYILDHE